MVSTLPDMMQPDPETTPSDKSPIPAVPANLDQLQSQLEQLLPKQAENKQADAADDEGNQ